MGIELADLHLNSSSTIGSLIDTFKQMFSGYQVGQKAGQGSGYMLVSQAIHA